jgi:hypothetical protein
LGGNVEYTFVSIDTLRSATTAGDRLHGGGDMTTTLSLGSAGYVAAKAAAAAGRKAESHRLCSTLLATPGLSPTMTARVRRLAAALDAGAGRHTAARRHLRAAARVDPEHAGTRFRLAQAYEHDPFGSDLLAAKHYRAAAQRERGNALYRAAFGRTAVKAGFRKAGCRALVRAAKLAPTDLAVLALAVDGLLHAGRIRTARRLVTPARFLAGPNGKIAAMMHRVRYAELWNGQQTPRSNSILPFIRVQSTGPSQPVPVIVRKDAASRPKSHLVRRPVRKSRG